MTLPLIMEKNEGMVSIRKAQRQDTSLILDFIKGIAKYEKLLHEVKATTELLDEWLFEKKIAEVVFIMEKTTEVGFVLYFYNFSTFVGKAGIYIEDLYVKPEYRGKGYGKTLINYIISKGREEGLGRVEWTCLDWNEPSINFYKSIGAAPMTDWTHFRYIL